MCNKIAIVSLTAQRSKNKQVKILAFSKKKHFI